MTKKTTTKGKDEQRHAWIAIIEDGIAHMEAAQKLASERFEASVIGNVTDPHALARKMSEKFESLSFSVTYSAGRHAIIAKPDNRRSWAADGEDYQLERTAQTVTATVRDQTVEQTAASMWPSFHVVQAYAEGYQALAADYKALQGENERLRASREDAFAWGSMHSMFPPRHPFFGR